MKYLIFSFLILFGSNPLMVKGYLLAENSQCKCTIYREEYVKGIPSSPVYIKAWEEDILLPYNQKNSLNNNSPQINNFERPKKCYRKIGSLIGGSIAVALSTKYAYG
tara:strand:+ start:83 stop:403 length:321 start_codon:yes stop_codon:yes gene_type:complete